MHSHVREEDNVAIKKSYWYPSVLPKKNILNDYKHIPALAIWVLLTCMVTNHHEKLTAEIKFGILQNWKEMNH